MIKKKNSACHCGIAENLIPLPSWLHPSFFGRSIQWSTNPSIAIILHRKQTSSKVITQTSRIWTYIINNYICEYGSNLGTQIWDGLLFDMDQNLLSLSSKSINGGWHESEQIDSTNPSYSQRVSLAHILHGAGIFINTSESASLPVILVPYNNPYMGYLNLGRLPGFTCAKNKPCCSLAWCPHHALHHPKGAEVTRSRRTPARSRSINWWSHGQSWNSWDSIGISWDSIGISCDFLGI